MKVELAVKDYLIEEKIRKHSKQTINHRRIVLNMFVRYLNEVEDITEVEEITKRTVRSYTQYLVESNKKGSYINSLLRVVKVFIQYCYDEDYGGFNTTGGNIKFCKEEKPVIDVFTVEDVQLLLKNCNGFSFTDVRDKAIITMFIETGIRNSELCNIKAEDIRDDYVVINGKNHKQRIVPLTPVLQKAMLRYEMVKERYFKSKVIDSYYFLSYRGRQLDAYGNEYILKRRGEGITDARISPHTCRHFFAQQQVKMGTDLFTISKLLGHENIEITQIYLNGLRDDDLVSMTKNRSVLMNM